MSIKERARAAIVRPTFQEEAAQTGRTRDDVAAVRTYRYLRMGMVVVTIALVAAVWRQRTGSGCYQGSISAYYYTPARPVFVAGMVAVGVMLIVLKGNTVPEDLLLDVAGMLAPIVALVPTGYEPVCRPGMPFDHGDGTLTAGIRSEVQNNLWAYLVAASAAVAIALAVFLRDQWRERRDPPGSTVARVVLLATTAVAVGVGWWAFTTDRILEWHAWAAIVMFGLLALASIWNGVALIVSDPSTPWQGRGRLDRFACAYIATGLLMAVVGIYIKWIRPDPWDHRTLVLELAEIALFALIWIIQSIERWNKVLLPAPPARPLVG